MDQEIFAQILVIVAQSSIEVVKLLGYVLIAQGVTAGILLFKVVRDELSNKG